jgi:hypothetical protein
VTRASGIAGVQGEYALRTAPQAGRLSTDLRGEPDDEATMDPYGRHLVQVCPGMGAIADALDLTDKILLTHKLCVANNPALFM